MSNRRAWSVAFICLLLAACRAPGESGPGQSGLGDWRRPDTDETRALADERDCRRLSQAEVDRESRRDRIFGEDGLGRPGTYDAMVARHDAQRRIDRLASECMRRRGYAPAPK